MGKGPFYPEGCEIPDYRTIKIDREQPYVKKYLDKLKKENLPNDPFLRNYYHVFGYEKSNTFLKRFGFMRHGFLTGLGVALGITLYTKYFPAEVSHWTDNPDYQVIAEKEGRIKPPSRDHHHH